MNESDYPIHLKKFLNEVDTLRKWGGAGIMVEKEEAIAIANEILSLLDKNKNQPQSENITVVIDPGQNSL